MDKSNLRRTIIVLAFTTLFVASYYMVEYRTFGSPTITRALSTDFSYFEDYFQEEPEELLAPKATEVSSIKVPIFIYHSVRPYIPGESVMQDRFDITPELFQQQLSYLQSHGYTTITPNMLERDIKMGTTTPIAKPVMLTFDDGWENQYKYAYPLLKRYHMVATFYVYTKPIDNAKLSYLSWDQLHEMQTGGMTIGSHTLTHPLLRRLPLADAERQVTESKKVLEKELQRPVLHFAPPYGYTNPQIETLIKKAGYTTARGTHRGVVHSANDLYNLQGYFVSDSLNEFIYILNR